MRPDENENRRLGTPLIPQRSFVRTPPSNLQRSSTTANSTTQQAQAAAQIVRGQLDNIYNNDPNHHLSPEQQAQQTAPPAAQQQPQQTTSRVGAVEYNPHQESPVKEGETTDTLHQQSIEYKNPYHRTQQNPAQVQANQWKQYHSAWQDYYQKYYERYYINQVHRTQQALQERAAQAAAATPTVAPQAPAQNRSTAKAVAPAQTTPSTTEDQALVELRNKLRNSIQTSAQKVRRSRHFMPIMAAVSVMIVFLFLQFNRVLIANVQAYVSPGNTNSANVIIDPASELSIGDEPLLIIPKLNIEVPVDYTATPDHNSQMAAMENGVAWFGIPGANSKPGQVGNTVISGHSSNDIIDQGQYKFIFARLDALQPGDNIYLNYEGKRYVYSVSKKETVKPTDVHKLIYETDKPMLTLITCTPLGTAINRLLVTAEQISPNPSEAVDAPTQDPSAPSVAMPGNSPTFLERVLGGGN